MTAMNTDSVAKVLCDCADDPMWADHAEVSKVLLRHAASLLIEQRNELERLRSDRKECNDCDDLK